MERTGTRARKTVRCNNSPPTSKQPFLRRHFNPRIIRVAPEKVESGSENIRRVKVEIYCDPISLNVEPATGIRVAGLLIATAREYWRSRQVASTASPFPIPGNAAAARQTRRRLG